MTRHDPPDDATGLELDCDGVCEGLLSPDDEEDWDDEDWDDEDWDGEDWEEDESEPEEPD